jgi:hypothetical protein
MRVVTTTDRKGTTHVKRFPPSLFAAALAAALLTQTAARASFVPWTYNWSRSPVAVSANGGGTGGLTLTDEPLNHADGTSDVVATNIRSFSSAARPHPDSFNHATYALSMQLTDVTSGKSATLNFGGFFSGTLSATSANVVNTFTGLTQQQVVLGSHTYTVVIGPYAPPGPPTATNAGTISAHVFVDQDPDNGGGGGGHPSDAPEPSTLLLSCFGLSCLGAGAWRKKFRS